MTEGHHDLLVRPEGPGDADRISDIHVAAFAHHPFSRQTEHRIVEGLRDAGALSVSLVAEVDGLVVGHVAFSAVTIGGAPGWFALGPIGVDPPAQRRGVGGALVAAGLEALRSRGALGCVLVGEPGYYGRFGFRHDPGVTFEGIPPEYVLCLPLSAEIPSGEVAHHAAFSIMA